MKRIFSMILILFSLTLYSLEVTTFEIPQYDNDLPLDSFTDIAVDGSTGNLCLTGPGVWCEIPLKGDEPDWDKSFTASTGEFDLSAVAGRNDGVTVFEQTYYKIMDENMTYSIDYSGLYPSCMEFSGYVLLIGLRNGFVSSWETKGNTIKMISEMDCSLLLTGIALKDNTVFLSDSNRIYRCDLDYNIEEEFSLEFAVNGIAATGSVLWAVGMNDNKIYRLEGVYQ